MSAGPTTGAAAVPQGSLHDAIRQDGSPPGKRPRRCPPLRAYDGRVGLYAGKGAGVAGRRGAGPDSPADLLGVASVARVASRLVDGSCGQSADSGGPAGLLAGHAIAELRRARLASTHSGPELVSRRSDRLVPITPSPGRQGVVSLLSRGRCGCHWWCPTGGRPATPPHFPGSRREDQGSRGQRPRVVRRVSTGPGRREDFRPVDVGAYSCAPAARSSAQGACARSAPWSRCGGRCGAVGPAFKTYRKSSP
jgi:hypothetical protein